MISRRLFQPLMIFALTVATLYADLDLNLPVLPKALPPSDTFVLDSPLQVRVHIDGQPQLLLGMDQGRLRLVFPDQPDAEVFLPLDAPGIQLSYDPPEPYNDLALEQSLGNHRAVLDTMGSYADLLLPLLLVDAVQCNFHAIYLRYYVSVVAVEDLEFAIKITEGLPHSALSPVYLEQVRKLLARCIAEGNAQGAEKLLSILFAVMDEQEFASVGFSAADALRAVGEYALTARIYGTLATAENELLRERALLWAGYSSAVAGDLGAAERVLSAVPDLNRKNQNFLTLCLARGRLHLAHNEYDLALRYLSRAMVLTSVNATFKPELYYLLIQGHRASDQDAAAARLFNELMIFYPESPWMLKSQNEIEPTGLSL